MILKYECKTPLIFFDIKDLNNPRDIKPLDQLIFMTESGNLRCRSMFYFEDLDDDRLVFAVFSAAKDRGASGL